MERIGEEEPFCIVTRDGGGADGGAAAATANPIKPEATTTDTAAATPTAPAAADSDTAAGAATGGSSSGCSSGDDDDAAPARDQRDHRGGDDDDAAPARDAKSSGGKEHVLRQKEHILAAPTGVRVWCDGLAPTTSRQPFWEEALALATLALFVAWVHVVFALTVAAFFNRWAAAAAALLWATTLLPPGPLLWQAFLSNAVFRMWRRYFRFSVAYDGAVDLSQHYVFAEVPHAVFPLSQIVACSLGADAWREHKVYSIAAGALFRVPAWRNVFTWMGARPATAANFRRLLRRGSVGLIPGGIAEMFLSRAPEADVVMLLQRKGFVRLAVEAGAPLVPIYHFGAWDLYRWAAPRSWQAASRRWRVSLGCARRPLRLTAARTVFRCLWPVGVPIPVPKLAPSDPGFDAAVDDAHARLVAATRALFDRYKAQYPGYERRELVIV